MSFLEAPPFCKPVEQTTPGQRRRTFLSAGYALLQHQVIEAVATLLKHHFGNEAHRIAQGVERYLDRG